MAVRSLTAPGAGRFLVVGLAALSLLVGACGPNAAADASPVATTTVELPPSYKFVPAAITVPAGATVTWSNRDNFSHNVTLEGHEPLSMAPGQTVSRAFADPGTYPYVCSLHPRDMKGTVVVTGS